MAAGDYYSCDRCGRKAFYDAHLEWGTTNLVVDPDFGNPVSIKALCAECWKTHDIKIVDRRAPGAAPRRLKGDVEGEGTR